MKKSLRALLSVLASAGLILLSTTCNVGLGESVDTQAPKLGITYPPESAVIRGSFVLAGNCEDDKSVKSVSVVFRTSDESLSFGPYEAEVSGSKSWKITLNDYDEVKYAAYNGWQFPDGTYTAEVTVTDNAGHSTGPFSRAFDIDNTAPVFVVSAPGVKLSDVNAGTYNTKKYGSSFTVSGTIADKHKVGMTAKVYASEDDVSSVSPNVFSEAEVDTSGTSAVEFARYIKNAASSNTKNSNYWKIYGEDITDTSTAKPFKTTVILTDNAKVYTDPSEKINTTTGNETTKVFLNDSVYNDYLSGTTGRGLGGSDFMNILNGTKTGALTTGVVSDTCENVRTALEGVIVDTATDLLSFSLNPNADPTYQISGLDITSGDISSANFGSNTAAKNSGLTVIAQAGENETNIEPSTIKVWIYDLGKLETAVSAVEADKFINTLVTEVSNGTAVDSDGKSAVAGWTLVGSNEESKDSSSANYTYNTKITSAISINNYYLVAATGTDQDGAYFSQKNHYGFIGSASTNPPEIDFSGITDQAYLAVSGDAAFAVKVTQTDLELASLDIEVTVKDETSGNKIDGTFTQSVDLSSAGKNSDGDYEYTHNFKLSDVSNYSQIKLTSECGKAYFYTVKFTAKNKSGGQTQNQISLHVDAVKPVVTITSVSPYADGADYTSITGVEDGKTYLNGTIKVQGNITETNLKDVSYEVYVDGVKAGSAVSLGNITQFNPAIDTTSYTDGKEIVIKVTATDEVGNKGSTDTTVYNTEAYIIKQETDTPQITLTNADVSGTDAANLSSSNVFTDSASNVITGTITDDDGIAKVTATLYSEDGTQIKTETIYEAASNYRTSYKIKYALPAENGKAVQGIYGVKFDVFDSTWSEGKDLRTASTGTFYAGVDTGNPALTAASTAEITKEGFTFSGNAGDVNGIKSLQIIDTSNENKAYNVDISSFTKENQANSWSYAFVTGTANASKTNYVADGKHTFQIKAVDSTDKSSTQTITVSVDTTSPVFSEDPVASIQGTTPVTINGKTWYKTNSLPLKGTASDGDNGTGIASVEYIVSSSSTLPAASAAWKQFAGTTSFSGTAENIVSGTSYVWIKLTDNAGNSASGKIGPWYIDTTAPELTADSVKVGGSVVSESSPYYSNGTKDAAVTFFVADAESGISKVYVNAYSQLTSDTETDANKAAVSNGSASFTIDKAKFTKSGTVYARIYDYAGNYSDVSLFAVTFDNTKPKSNNPAVEDTSSYTAYKDGTTGDGKPFYYINNADGTFTFSGIATDNLGIAQVKLTVSDGTHTVEKVTADSEWKFENVSLSSLTGASATAVITITDLAGNTAEHSAVNPAEISLSFDTRGPSGYHQSDAKGKDIYFRLGDTDNDDITESDSLWDADLDKDVGGKYLAGTYGNANTIKIRGKFSDGASDVKMIYYKVSQTAFSSSDITSFTKNYADERTGYFAPLSASETRRVFYNVNAGGTDSLGGTKLKTKESYDIYYNTFESNFDATISGFQVGTNYLMLVAVDNVGNAAIDTVNSYRINVDTDVPTAEPDSTDTVLSNGKKNDSSVADSTTVVSISGTANDAAAGLRSIYFTAGGKTISSDVTTYGTIEISETDDNNWSWTLNLKKALFKAVSASNISVSAVVTDDAGSGNSQSYAVGNITVDTVAPTITLNTPTDAIKSTTGSVDINKTIDLSGNAEDGNTLPAETISAVQYSKNGTAWTDAAVTISGNYSFSAEGFDTTALDDETTYYLRAVGTDAAGNTGYSNTVTVFVNQKSDRPVINFTNLTVNADGEYILKLNDAGTVEGTVTDDDSTASAVIKSLTVKEVNESGTVLNTVSPSVTASGDFTFVPSDTADGTKYFVFTVKDNNDSVFSSNTNTTDYTTIPVLSVKTAAIADADTASSSFAYNADNLAPVIDSVKMLDYDGNAEGEQISAALVTGGTKYPSVSLKISASDANGIAGMTAVIRKTDGTSLQYKSTSGTTLAGKTLSDGLVYASGFAVDSSDTTKAVWTLPAVSVEDLASGSVTVTVTPYDNSGLTGNSTNTFTVDNDGPAVNITSHKNANSDTSVQYNGSVTLTGLASDSNDVTKVEWLVPTQAQRSSWASYSASQKASLDWAGDVVNSAVNFTFTGENLFDEYTSRALSSGTDSVSNTDWYIIPVYFKATDEFGNIGYTTGYAIKFNPDLDKMQTSISNPAENDQVGGAIRVIGNTTTFDGAQEGTSVNSVYVQIGSTSAFPAADRTVAADTYGYSIVSGYDIINEFAGTAYSSSSKPTAAVARKYGFASLSALDSWWGIKSNTTGWRLILNEDGTMNPSGDDVNTVYLRAAAVNTNGKVGDWCDSRKIDVTTGAPTITEKLYQFTSAPTASNLSTVTAASNVLAEKDYTGGVYIKNQWYLEVTATEPKTNAKVSIESIYRGTNKLTAGTDYFVTADSTAQVKAYVAVDKDATSTLVYKVTAVDGSEKYSATSTYSINVDNTAPLLNALYSDYDKKNAISMTKIENSNYKYDIYSTAVEEGSGLDFVAVYFKRGTQIELPLPDVKSYTAGVNAVVKAGSAYTGNLTQVTGEAGEVLYGVSGSVTCTESAGVTTITSASLITSANSFIRRGSLVKLSGSYYVIKSVNTSAHTATVEASFGTLPTSAFFAAAAAINASGEGASISSGETTITKDDGDGFLEDFESSGSNYAWQLQFFSDEMKDGEIEIIAVAADKAGNYRTKSTKVMLTNHKPRVSKVFLATDLNGDGVYTQDEFEYTATNNGVETTAYAYSALDDSGNEQIAATLSTGTLSIRDGMAVTFEMLGASNGNAARTGGGNNLYYIPKLMTADEATDEAKNTPASGSTTSKLADMKGTASGKINLTASSDKVSSTTGLTLTNTNIKAVSGWASSMENETALTSKSVVQLTIWDDVNISSGTIGTDDTVVNDEITSFGNQYTIINIPVYFDMTDGVPPASEVTPFYWTKEKSSGGKNYSENNSLYFKVTKVESTDSYDDKVTDEKTSTTTYYTYTPMGHIELGDKPSVSGVIKVEGTVSDDQRLSSIAVTYGGTAVGTITYSASAHTWSSAGTITSGYVLSAEDTAFGQGGHTAKWTLLLDTAKYGNAATKAIVATAAQAKDGTKKTAAATYNVSAVPYITGISRPAGTNTYHSSTGRTSVIEGETLTVTGFNFGTSGSWTIGSKGSGTYTGITNSTPSAAASFTLTAPACSGALTVTSTTASLNNSNASEDYNLEVRVSGEDEDTFRDDRYVYVWNVNHTVSGSGAVSLMPTIDFDKNGRIYTAWSQTGKSTIELSKDLNASNRIFICYDQPTAYSALAVEKSTGNMGVTMFPDHLGNGGQFTDRWALANGNNCGGAGFIAVNNNSYLGVNAENTSGSQSNTGRSPLIGINAAAITENVLNPNIYLDNNVDSPYYQVGTHEFARNLGSFSAPQTARYSNYGHSLYYDETTGSLKYTVVTLPTSADDTSNNDGAYNGGRMFDTVVIDGPSAPYDRQHETVKGTPPAGYRGFKATSNAATTTGTNGYYKYDYTQLTPSAKSTTSCTVTFPTRDTAWKTLIDANGAGLAFLTTDRYDSFPTRDVKSVTWSNNNLTAEFTFDAVPNANYTMITVYAGHKTNVAGVGGRYASAAATGYVKAAGSAGDYSSIDVTSTGCPVIMYKAGTSVRLAYTISTTPAYSDWTVMDTGLSGGLYISMKIDTAATGVNKDRLHAVYKNGSKLMYVSATRNTTTGAYTFGTPEVIDTNGSLTMSTLSLYGNSPVVTYLNSESSEDGVKYAKKVTLADDTSVWDYSVIPAVVAGGTEYYVSPNNYRVYVGANAGDWRATQDSVSMANCEAFVGYKTSRIDVVFLKKE
jgi:hypothetical protein